MTVVDNTELNTSLLFIFSSPSPNANVTIFTKITSLAGVEISLFRIFHDLIYAMYRVLVIYN